MPSYSFKWSTPDADDASIVVRNGAGTVVATGTTADVVAVTNEAFVTYTVDLPAGDTYTATATVLGRSRSTVGVLDTSVAALSATFAPVSAAKWGAATQPLTIPSVWAHTEDVGAKLHYAKARGFTAITFGDLSAAVTTGKPLPPKPFLLSFDDEATQWITVIDPLLALFGWRATGFISTGYPDGEQMTGGTDPFFYTNTTSCTWTQLRALRDTGRWEFQNHSRTHPSFDALSKAQRDAEWNYSQARILAELGVVPTVFCHPRDTWSFSSVQDAFDYGFKVVSIGSQDSGYGPADKLNPQVLANRDRNKVVIWRGGVNSTTALENDFEPIGNRIPDSPMDDNDRGVWAMTGGTSGSATQGARFDEPDKSATIDFRTDGSATVGVQTAYKIATKPGETVLFEYYRQCGVTGGSFVVTVKEYDMNGAFLRDVVYETLTGTVSLGQKKGVYTAATDVFYTRIAVTMTGAPAGSYGTFQFPFFGSVR